MASIIPRKNKDGKITSYKIRVSMGYDEDGSKIFEDTKYIPSATTPAKVRKEVEQFAVEFEKAVKEGSAFTSGDRITLKRFVQIWEENSLSQKVLSGTMTKHTKEEYIRTMYFHVIPKIGHMKLNEIKSTHIDGIVLDLLDAGKAPKSVRNYFNIIRSCFDYAFRKNYIKENPCLRCEPLPVVHRDGKLHTFTEEQVKRFLNEALIMEYEYTYKGHSRRYSEVGSGEEFSVKEYTEHRSVPLQFRVYFTLAVFGGFRRGELVGLNWEDIDPKNKTVSIKRAVSLSSDGQYCKQPKTEAGKRTIKLPETCFILLSQWKSEQRKICLSLGTVWEGFRGKDYDQNPVFIQSDTGKRMNVQSPSETFRKILTEYNKTVDEADRLPLIRLHDLRHTNATHLVASGVDFETIAKRLGHSRASFTLDVYGHALPENDEKASDKLEEIFTGTR